MLWLFSFGNVVQVGGSQQSRFDLSGLPYPLPPWYVVPSNSAPLSWPGTLHNMPAEWLRFVFGVKTWRAVASMSADGFSQSFDETFKTGQGTQVSNGVKTTTGEAISNFSEQAAYVGQQQGEIIESETRLQWNFSDSNASWDLDLFPDFEAFFDTGTRAWYMDWLVTLNVTVFKDSPAPDLFFSATTNNAASSPGGDALDFLGTDAPVELTSGLTFDLSLEVVDWL